jgi:hypothetical protein
MSIEVINEEEVAVLEHLMEDHADIDSMMENISREEWMAAYDAYQVMKKRIQAKPIKDRPF